MNRASVGRMALASRPTEAHHSRRWPMFGRRKSTGQSCDPCWSEYQAEVPASWRVSFACRAGHVGDWSVCDDHTLLHDAYQVVPGNEPECPNEGCIAYMSAEAISFEQLARG